MKLRLIHYEEKYKFIDIGKLHEETQRAMSQAEESKFAAARLKKDLLQIRQKILEATMKFDRGGKKESKKERKKREEEEEWKGSEDVEKLCNIFTTYLTSAANTSWKGDATAKSEKTEPGGKSKSPSKKSKSKTSVTEPQVAEPQVAEPDGGFTEQVEKGAD